VQSEVSPARFEVGKAELGVVVERFIRASNDGDLEALFQVLDPAVAGWTDTGGVARAPREAINGRDRVANTLLAFLRTWNVTLRPMPVNGEPGAASYVGDDLMAVLAFEVRDGLITKIHSVANPDKLRQIPPRRFAPPSGS
jgi:RNA polymerase sigma-70 factor (ECF subfamily)